MSLSDILTRGVGFDGRFRLLVILTLASSLGASCTMTRAIREGAGEEEAMFFAEE